MLGRGDKALISVTITERRAGIYVVALVLAVALSLLTGQKLVEDYPMSDQASCTDRTRGSFSALADDLLAGEGLLPLPLPAFSTGGAR